MGDRVIRTRAGWTAGYRRVLEARSLDTPADRLRILAFDEIRPVRLYVARNPSTPPDALVWLASDPDESVRWNVLLNVNRPAEARRNAAAREATHGGGRRQLERH